MNNVSKFNQRLGGFSEIRNEFKNKIFVFLTKKSMKLFLRGGDIISINPQVNGVHELSVTQFINHCVQKGYSEFLIDIGANVGLTTCQNGHPFKRIVCFEPNPLCVHILSVNIEISGLNDKAEIFSHGLGDGHGEFELYVPRHNWGGAFVQAADNNYSEDVLAAKDGFKTFDKANYSVQKISIRPAEVALAEVFASFRSENLRTGVVKIDVEGMERTVLAGVGKALPKDVDVVILLENWDKSLDFSDVQSLFDGRSVELGKLAHRRPFQKHWPRALKAASLLFSSSEIYVQDIAHAEDSSGDLVLIVR